MKRSLLLSAFFACGGRGLDSNGLPGAKPMVTAADTAEPRAISRFTFSSEREATIVYEDETLAWSALSTNDHEVLLRFQQHDGWLVWVLDLPDTLGAGTTPLATTIDARPNASATMSSADMPAIYRDAFFPTSTPGTITIERFDHVVQGSIDVTVAGAKGATLRIESEFRVSAR